jgi:hypothetical protein
MSARDFSLFRSTWRSWCLGGKFSQNEVIVQASDLDYKQRNGKSISRNLRSWTDSRHSTLGPRGGRDNGIIGGGIFGLPAPVFKLIGTYSLVAFVVCAVVVTLIILCFAE